MIIQTLKGFRDFLPQEARKRQYVINTLKSVFESYGFEPLETPALEYEEILTGKYGEEGDKLMYRFTDNGGRRVAMRYDQTVPLARVVAQYGSVNSPQGQPILPLPFKRYQIQNVWRADNTQKGRFREFLQCDIDTVGSESPTADAEIVASVNASFEKLGFKDFMIQINDRSLFGDLPPQAILIIDKLEKQGKEQVEQELVEKGFAKNLIDDLVSKEQPASIVTIMHQAKSMGVADERLIFNPSLARGLDYYTGMIIEVTIANYPVGSVGGGGRYDKLIGMFAKQDYPAVGFAFGFDRVLEAMNEQNLFPPSLTNGTRVLVSIFNAELERDSIAVSSQLRANDINTELWLDRDVKMERQLKYADQKGIPYVIVLGPEEKEKNVVTLKDMKTRKQKLVTLEEAIATLSN